VIPYGIWQVMPRSSEMTLLGRAISFNLILLTYNIKYYQKSIKKLHDDDDEATIIITIIQATGTCPIAINTRRYKNLPLSSFDVNDKYR